MTTAASMTVDIGLSTSTISKLMDLAAGTGLTVREVAENLIADAAVKPDAVTERHEYKILSPGGKVGLVYTAIECSCGWSKRPMWPMSVGSVFHHWDAHLKEAFGSTTSSSTNN